MNNTFRSGVDLDDSTVVMVRRLINFFNRETGSDIRYENVRSYDLWKAGIGRNKDESVSWIKAFYASPEFNSLRLIPHAKETITFLASKGQVYFITARFGEGQAKTVPFVKRHFNGLDIRTVFTSHFDSEQKNSKADACHEYGINVLVEDNANYALQCAPFVDRVYLFTRHWNQDINVNGNIRRVKHWREIMEAET